MAENVKEMIGKLEDGERLVNAYFIGCKRVPNKREYYVLNILTFNKAKRDASNSAYTLLELFPKFETCPKEVIPAFTKIRCVFEDLEEGAKPRFIRFFNLEEDLKLNTTAPAVQK